MYTHDTAIKMVIFNWNLEIKIYMIYSQKQSPEMIYARRKMNSNYKYLALDDCFSGKL